MSYSNPFYPDAEVVRSPHNRTPSVIRQQFSNTMDRTNSFSANDDSKSQSSNSFRITFQSDNAHDVDSTRNGSQKMNSPMNLSPIKRVPNDRATSPFVSMCNQNFSNASKFRKLKTDISTELMLESDSRRLSKRSQSRLVNQDSLSHTQSVASMREISPNHSPRVNILQDSSKNYKFGKNLPSLQNALPYQSLDNISQTQKTQSQNQEFPFTKTYETFGLKRNEQVSKGMLNDRENNPQLQSVLNENVILREELAACRAQQEKYARLYEQSRINEDKISEKVSKFETVIKTIREENRVLRTKIQDLDFIVTSNHVAEEMATKYEEEKRVNDNLVDEINRLRASLQESQQAYIDLVNEFNRTKLTLIKNQRSIEAFPTSVLVSNHNEPKAFLSKTNPSDDFESTIVNTDIKRMYGSRHDDTLNSIFAGTSDILKRKIEDSCFNSNAPNIVQEKFNGGQNSCHANPSSRSPNDHQMSAQRRGHSPLLSAKNSKFQLESDAKDSSHRYLNVYK